MLIKKKTLLQTTIKYEGGGIETVKYDDGGQMVVAYAITEIKSLMVSLLCDFVRPLSRLCSWC